MALKEGELNWGGIFIGLLLVGLGVLFLLRELHVTTGSILIGGWWALLIVALGLSKLLRPHRAKHVGEGVMLAILGAWLFLAHTERYGLSYENSWPLVLVAVGAGMVARALAQRWLPDRVWVRTREDHHA